MKKKSKRVENGHSKLETTGKIKKKSFTLIPYLQPRNAVALRVPELKQKNLMMENFGFALLLVCTILTTNIITTFGETRK